MTHQSGWNWCALNTGKKSTWKYLTCFKLRRDPCVQRAVPSSCLEVVKCSSHLWMIRLTHHLRDAWQTVAVTGLWNFHLQARTLLLFWIFTVVQKKAMKSVLHIPVPSQSPWNKGQMGEMVRNSSLCRYQGIAEVTPMPQLSLQNLSLSVPE